MRRASASSAGMRTRSAMKRIEHGRENRRKSQLQRRSLRAEEERTHLAAGNAGDLDFTRLVTEWRETESGRAQPHSDLPGGCHPKICICVRKRPVNEKERQKKDHDAVTVLHPTVWVHSPKMRVDGITKYLDNNPFTFDHAFDETSTTDDVYRYSTMPLVDFVCSGKGGRGAVFAYGQTGSGKTHTMNGLQRLVAEDVFLLLEDDSDADRRCTMHNTTVTLSGFELYGGKLYDLLNNRAPLKILEDGKGDVVISGLEEYEANDSTDFLQLIEAGNEKRSTHETEANATSSRSHAIFTLMLRDKATSRLRGKLSLIDLAGSERGNDTKMHNQKRRNEGAEINTSLLALKECIRALESGTSRIPYRQSKLTMVLKDSFASKSAKTTMIATVSPGSSSSDHTLNTLRYADRVKEKKLSKSNRRQSAPGAVSLSPAPVKVLRDLEEVQEESYQSEIEEDTSSDEPMKETSFQNDADTETQMREASEPLFEAEENLLNHHMEVLQKDADLLTEEGTMINAVSQGQASDHEVERYVERLSDILDTKEKLYLDLQESLDAFKSQFEEGKENFIAT